jgi:hypothetical protein
VSGGRKNIGKVIELEGGFVGEGTVGSSPEQGDHELFARGDREVP